MPEREIPEDHQMWDELRGKDTSANEMWAELRKRQPGVIIPENSEPIFLERQENAKFFEIQRILPNSELNRLYLDLKKMRLSIRSKDMRNVWVNGAMAFTDVAAALKEFDPEGFTEKVDSDINIYNKVLKPYLEKLKNEKDVTYGVKYLYNLKILYPEAVGSEKDIFEEKFKKELQKRLHIALEKEDWISFLPLFSKLSFVNKKVAEDMVKITQKQWMKILEFIQDKKSKKDEKFEKGIFIAQAQACCPNKFKAYYPSALDAEWNGYVESLKENFYKKRDPRFLITKGNELKYLKIINKTQQEPAD